MKVFIGYDQREEDAFLVCKHSIARHASDCVEIIPLKQSNLRKNGLYTREFEEKDGQKYDKTDGKPFSTEFSFTRFLVPYLCNYQGLALFVDCDFLFTRDIAELFALVDRRYAVQCVKHDFRPEKGLKMDGQIQEPYPCKNWSSLMLFNNARNHQLTPDLVNRMPGSWLHRFRWLNEDEIGALPTEWNFLVGHNSPAGIHYTNGIPTMPGYERCAFAGEWFDEYERAYEEQEHEGNSDGERNIDAA